MSSRGWRLFVFRRHAKNGKRANSFLSRTCASASGYALGFTASVIIKMLKSEGENGASLADHDPRLGRKGEEKIERAKVRCDFFPCSPRPNLEKQKKLLLNPKNSRRRS